MRRFELRSICYRLPQPCGSGSNWTTGSPKTNTWLIYQPTIKKVPGSAPVFASARVQWTVSDILFVQFMINVPSHSTLCNLCSWKRFIKLLKIKYYPRWLSPYSEMLRAGRPGFDSRQRQEILLQSVQNGSRSLLSNRYREHSPGAKRQWREADCSLPSSTEIKNGGAIPALPISLRGIVLNTTFAFTVCSRSRNWN
jgi:hypothetical protein